LKAGGISSLDPASLQRRFEHVRESIPSISDGDVAPLASKPIMLLGNLASIVVTIAGILQVLSWTIAGATILAVLSITTLAPTRGPGSGAGHSINKKTRHDALAETKPYREKSQEKQPPRPHQTPSKPEPRQVPKNEIQRSTPSPSRSEAEFQKAMSPNITPPKTIPTNVSPAKPSPGRPGTPKQEAIRPIPVGTGSTLVGPAKPIQPRIDPNSRVIAKGDYAKFDVELDQRAEVACEVTASAPVNVYIMDADNLNSLDLGEEFWSESGEEGVEKATLHFVAPQKGKWFLVVENTDNREASTRVNIRKTPPKTGPPA
jgi:hypothetical protein